MLFKCKSKDNGRRRGGSEQLIIVGDHRSRRGAELKGMSGTEIKSPCTFTRGVRDKETDIRRFDTDRMIFKDDELS